MEEKEKEFLFTIERTSLSPQEREMEEFPFQVLVLNSSGMPTNIVTVTCMEDLNAIGDRIHQQRMARFFRSILEKKCTNIVVI